MKKHQEHWERLTREKICPEDDGIETIKALEIAIKAIEGRPQGKWHHSGECPFCHKRSLRTTPLGDIIGIDFSDFCKNCGADMRGAEK